MSDPTTSTGSGEIQKRGAMASLVEWLKSVDKWWTILLLLFCVTGVLGIPILLLSRAYGVGSKIGLSILVTVYTAFLFWLVYLVIVFAYKSIEGSM